MLGANRSPPPPTPQRIAFTNFDEPDLGADSYSPDWNAEELGFGSTISPQGSGEPLVGVSDSGAQTAPTLTHQSALVSMSFDQVDLTDWTDVNVALDVLVGDTTYGASDILWIFVTNGQQRTDLLNVTGTQLNNLGGSGFVNYSVLVPGDWSQAKLTLISSSNSDDGAERFEFDNITFTGMPNGIAGAPAALSVNTLGPNTGQSPDGPRDRVFADLADAEGGSLRPRTNGGASIRRAAGQPQRTPLRQHHPTIAEGDADTGANRARSRRAHRGRRVTHQQPSFTTERETTE